MAEEKPYGFLQVGGVEVPILSASGVSFEVTRKPVTNMPAGMQLPTHLLMPSVTVQYRIVPTRRMVRWLGRIWRESERRERKQQRLEGAGRLRLN